MGYCKHCYSINVSSYSSVWHCKHDVSAIMSPLFKKKLCKVLWLSEWVSPDSRHVHVGVSLSEEQHRGWLFNVSLTWSTAVHQNIIKVCPEREKNCHQNIFFGHVWAPCSKELSQGENTVGIFQHPLALKSRMNSWGGLFSSKKIRQPDLTWKIPMEKRVSTEIINMFCMSTKETNIY